jgi:hypothetical protein
MILLLVVLVCGIVALFAYIPDMDPASTNYELLCVNDMVLCYHGFYRITPPLQTEKTGSNIIIKINAILFFIY